jgi:hypothetical protein
VGQKLIVSGATTDVKPAEKTAPSEATRSAAVQEKKEKRTNIVPAVREPNAPAQAREDVNGSPALTALADSKTYKSWKTENTSDRIESNKATPTYDPASEYESLYYQNVYSGLAKTETGVVRLMKDNNPACTAYYSNATVGTILKLTNPANGKTTYALVIGKVPPAESNSYLLKISDRVSRNLAIKDYASVEVVCYTANN